MPPVAVKQEQSFLQLDIVGTVSNFLLFSDFWRSGEWIESVKEGEILSLDYKYFSDYLSSECERGRCGEGKGKRERGKREREKRQKSHRA